jgi:hypothetical protein
MRAILAQQSGKRTAAWSKGGHLEGYSALFGELGGVGVQVQQHAAHAAGIPQHNVGDSLQLWPPQPHVRAAPDHRLYDAVHIVHHLL